MNESLIEEHLDTNASVDEIASDIKIRHSWGHILKLVFIIAKISLIVGYLMIATFKYYKRERRLGFVTGLLTCTSIILLIILFLDLTTKWIWGFFICCLGVNYINFIGLTHIWRKEYADQ